MKKKLITLLFALSLCANANVKMPLLFSDGMVLQRNKPISVWGWADSGEKIEVAFNKQIQRTKADKNGKWLLYLKPEKAGGPFKMTIKGKNSITIENVLVGEVWICSGQSNMEWTVGQAQNADYEISQADNPWIRQFLVDKDLNSTPKEEIKAGSWKESSKKNTGAFTAVGYFFAKKVYNELKIPIGIINASWGGTCSETWTSKEAFEKSPEFSSMIADLPKGTMDSFLKNKLDALTAKIEALQKSKITSNSESQYKTASFDDSAWPEVHAPQLWNQQLGSLDGTVWMRKSFIISKEDASKEALLELGKIDDEDLSYVNGIEVGKNTQWDKKRIYKIPSGTLKEGINTVAVRVTDYSGGGGIFGDEADLKLTVGTTIVPLAGKWKFQVTEIKTDLSPNSYPSLLYNAMINPLVPYSFQGVLWYQGEANATRAEQYKKAFPLLINDWRTKWNQGDFPFFFVQLSSFNEFGGNSSVGSYWAELREAQAFTLNNVANTGMCVTADIGDPKDIHPKNKQEVGYRLAAIALNKVYEKGNVFSGPAYKSMETKGNQILLTFDNAESGLTVHDKYQYVKGFEVAGSDHVFHYAKAQIKGSQLLVWSDQVQNPEAVRYGWADDASDCNLYNAENFPAAPFRTDDWDTISKGIKYSFEK
ncbi:DUF303 multi-domain protein [Flavobacterium anhuiense]|uniref:DUF303 multi-domain protein n=1 Tax=Flavobacterium anhuiense TaxID=459526 RepID=A0A444VT07_9FLAO|nr:sialate O-acetylesterase [Flavobacterium anhuiense]RYJ36586.1 DUF303 multi-domain protein [Flavobacterium anhuiense]